jgi:hypothetical protein
MTPPRISRISSKSTNSEDGGRLLTDRTLHSVQRKEKLMADQQFVAALDASSEVQLRRETMPYVASGDVRITTGSKEKDPHYSSFPASAIAWRLGTSTAMITGGANPVQAESTDLVDGLGAIGDEPEALVNVWDSQSAISPALRSRLLANDMAALNANWACDAWVEIDDVLTTFGQPYLLIMGENHEMYPPMKDYSKQLPERSLDTLPGVNHLSAFQRSALVIPIVTGFLETVTA